MSAIYQTPTFQPEQLHTKSNPINTPIDSILIVIWGIFFLFFPSLFTTIFTEPIIFPKEIMLLIVILTSVILWGLKIFLEGKIHIRRTPFDIPILLFIIVTFISSLIAVNKSDSLVTFPIVAMGGISYFILVNIIKKQQSLLFLLTSLVTSGIIVSLLYLFTFFRIYLLPFAFTHTPTFTPLGALLDQALFLLFILPIPGYIGFPVLQGKVTSKTTPFFFGFILISIGFIFTLIPLLTTQKPTILPFAIGFQIAFSTISQDTGRMFQSFFFGSGLGTFATDFTRFKPLVLNTNQDLWYLTFTHSSSFILELLTTTGMLGIASFILIFLPVYRKTLANRSNPIFLSLTFFLITACIFSLSFIEIPVFFMLLALFAIVAFHHHPASFYEFELKGVSLKKPVENSGVIAQERVSKFIPGLILAIIISIVGVLGFFCGKYILSDWYFERSVLSASLNNGTQTYNNQLTAITLFPYRDLYYRGFSQTNLILANGLIVSKNGKQLDADTQKNVYGLIQQAITSGRNATTVAPLTVSNWQNLASVYRQLIGFGQNAQQFAIASSQQAIAVDPTNPQEYITLGGMYYQLGQYDNAIPQFQTAVTLKSDYPNAYYNLGHALEQKGDLKDALGAYRIVKTLVTQNPTNSQKIDSEIAALQNKISQPQKPVAQPTPTPEIPKTASPQKQTLQVNHSIHTLPTQHPQISIPAISITSLPTK